MGFFPGSTIGNLEPDAAIGFPPPRPRHVWVRERDSCSGSIPAATRSG